MTYHPSGETVEYREIRKSKYTKDFSWGLYCTDNYDQAHRWARRNRKTPTINMYTIPTIDAIAKDFMYLVINTITSNQNLTDAIYNVFTSFISEEITDFNSSVYYSSQDYLKESYLQGELLA